MAENTFSKWASRCKGRAKLVTKTNAAEIQMVLSVQKRYSAQGKAIQLLCGLVQADCKRHPAQLELMALHVCVKDVVQHEFEPAHYQRWHAS